jgi:hypothetical protein
VKTPRSILLRLATGLTLGLAFLFMASVFVPDWSQAGEYGDGSMEREHVSGGAGASSQGLQSLGTIEDDIYQIQIWGGRDEPLYTVTERGGGEVGVLLTADEVARWFPDLPLPEMEYGVEGLIMLAEPPLTDF